MPQVCIWLVACDTGGGSLLRRRTFAIPKNCGQESPMVSGVSGFRGHIVGHHFKEEALHWVLIRRPQLRDPVYGTGHFGVRERYFLTMQKLESPC